MKKIVLVLLIALLVSSCFLAITGAAHTHTYKELNGKSDLELFVICSYLNKTFSLKNTNSKDSVYIKSSRFKKPKEEKSCYKINPTDSLSFYGWRIGDIKYHKNFKKDTIEVIKITKEGYKIKYKFIGEK